MLQKECKQAAKFKNDQKNPNEMLHLILQRQTSEQKKFTYKSSAGKYSLGLDTLNRNGTAGNRCGYINTLL